MGIAEYGRLDAVAMAELVKRREVSARELADEAIARIERVNPQLNAVVERLFDRGRDSTGSALPEGPFRGVPFATKNLLAPIAGVRIDSGSRFFHGHVAAQDSTLISRYRKAGLVFLATTNTPELGLLPFTEPELHGPTRNPYDPARTCLRAWTRAASRRRGRRGGSASRSGTWWRRPRPCSGPESWRRRSSPSWSPKPPRTSGEARS